MRVAAALALVLTACGEGTRDPGLEAWLRLSPGEYVRGALPQAGTGPHVAALNVSRSIVPRGETHLHLSGALSSDANAVALGLDGDLGHWVITAGLPDPLEPDQLTFAATAEIALDAPLGMQRLEALAISQGGEPGPMSTAMLEITERPHVTGPLVFTLSWDTDADLDLHVVDPTGFELWARDPTGPSQYLDADSEAHCQGDGLREENAVWTAAPPSGHYIARVDTFSLCGAPGAHWTLEVRRDGVVTASAEGFSTPASTRDPHQLGSGVLALELDLP
jgi:hypothetical protein